MANQTSRFGFNTFGGEVDGSILDDSGKYTGFDRQLIDTLFAALERHNHRYSPTDEAGPTDAPSGVLGTAGNLSAGLDYSYVVSFVDPDGLETPAGDQVTISTPDILDPPDAPSGETSVGGGLSDGSYDYAVTGVRGGEQSALGELFTVTVVDAEGTVTLALPDLGEATSLNVWRRKDTEGGFTLIANTALSSLVDVGAVSAYPFPTDPTYAPPTDNDGIDQYSVTITLSAADQALVQNYSSWRLYRTTTSGVYSAQSLVAQVVDRENDLDPESPLVTTWTDFGDALVTGKPALVDQRMHFEPFAFEEYVSLAAASGSYPLNYPIVVGDSLYLYHGIGDWVEIAGATGLPGGGTLGQVLAKASSVDGDAEWIDMVGGSGGGSADFPPGGTTGQVLAKASGADDDVEWVDMVGGSGSPDELPTGGTTGQVLAKASGTDGDVEWVDMEASSGGGGGASTTFDQEAGPFVAVNPTPQIVHSISVPAGKTLNFTWHITFKVTDPASLANLAVSGTGLLTFGSAIFTTLAGSQANPYPYLYTDASVIDTNTDQTCVVQGVSHNPTGSSASCEFKADEVNTFGSVSASSSSLSYWVG